MNTSQRCVLLILGLVTAVYAQQLDQVIKDVQQNFSTGFGSWIQATDDNFNWTRHKGCTSSINTGPCTDPMGSADGYYTYFNVSGLNNSNSAKLRFTSSAISNETLCFSFFYHMYGSGINTLNLFQNGSKIFNRTGDLGNKWNRALLELSGSLIFTIEATRGNSDLGDIAIDDISLYRGVCKTNISIENPAYSAAEDAKVISIKLQSSRSFSAIFSRAFRVRTIDGTATSGGSFRDYQPIDKIITFPQHQTELVFNLSVIADNLVEANETLKLNISELSPWPGANVVSNTEAVITIGNDDQANVGFELNALTVNEDAGTINVCVKVDQAAAIPLNVRVATIHGTTTAPSDFIPQINVLLTIPANTTTQRIDVRIINDSLVENAENFTIRLTTSHPSVRLNASRTNLVVTITDNDRASISLEHANYTVQEDTGYISISVILTGNSAIPLNVRVQTSDGSAISTGLRQDFTALNTTLTFQPGVKKLTFNVTINSDDRLEMDEMLAVRLTSLTAKATIGSVNKANVTILNDDSVSISFDKANIDVSENDARAIVAVTMTGKTDIPVSVRLSTVNKTAFSGHDFIATFNDEIKFAPTTETSTTMNITFNITNDILVESKENFAVVLTTVQRDVKIVRNETTVGIIDNDQATISLESASYSVKEDTGYISISIVLTGNSAIPLDVRVQTSNGSAGAGQDFTALNATLTFQPGVEKLTFNVTINADDRLEMDEMLAVSLTSQTAKATIGSVNKANVTILNDDSASISLEHASYSVKEDTGYISISVILTGANPIPLNVRVQTSDGSATSIGAGQDFKSLNETLTFQSGVKKLTFNVTITADDRLEMDEMLAVTLTSLTANATIGSVNKANVTILNDDSATIGFTNSSMSVLEGQGYVAACLRKEGQTAVNLTVKLADVNGTASSPEDYTTLDSDTHSVIEEFAANEVLKCVNVTIVDDNVTEYDEQFYLKLSTVNPTVLLGQKELNVTIVNDDYVVVQFAENQSTIVSEGNIAEIKVEMTDGVLGIPITINLTANQDAVQATTDKKDFLFIPNVELKPGNKTVTTSVATISDGKAESDEVLTLTLASMDQSRVRIGARNQVGIKIDDTKDRAGVTGGQGGNAQDARNQLFALLVTAVVLVSVTIIIIIVIAILLCKM